jgi:hypothetical protein
MCLIRKPPNRAERINKERGERINPVEYTFYFLTFPFVTVKELRGSQSIGLWKANRYVTKMEKKGKLTNTPPKDKEPLWVAFHRGSFSFSCCDAMG